MKNVIEEYLAFLARELHCTSVTCNTYTSSQNILRINEIILRILNLNRKIWKRYRHELRQYTEAKEVL
jgi:hypothetical protein